ncbi:hypothetical protein J437_LFUL000595 [Ladona fulva]|uniref:Serine/threonine-protein kinase RIO1 n=1 Tax=Ladona fulva TaxID=123851 RepID=A0A8K0KA07_LADFU|nr:hypothetical protein J437_LFUL000595 [Ladona fulva]
MDKEDNVVEGQFSDAEDSEFAADNTSLGVSKLLKIEKLSLIKVDGIENKSENYEDEDEFDEDDCQDYSDYEWEITKNGLSQVNSSRQPNSQAASRKITNYQPSDKLLGKYAHKINVNPYEVSSLSNNAKNRLLESDKRLQADRMRVKDKGDRATAEQVMDPRTRMILFKLLSRGTIMSVNGCISTGKEANVYHAQSGESEGDIAIKIYKTSILVFKDRDKYVGGEYRFRHGYCRHNPRKMVRTWAEKEMRNLVRIHSAGISCPKPILLRSHVLLMSFLGKDGWPSPRLKDVDLSTSRARETYRECVVIIWKMYNECKLVHADLSEFNLLEEFFRKKDVAVMTVRELFDFVTDPTINSNNMDECLDKLSEKASNRPIGDVESQVDEEVFMQTFIPKRMDEIVHFERDINQAKSGQGEKLVYETILGMKGDLSGPRTNPELLSESEDGSEEEGSNSDDDSSDENGSPKGKFKRKNAVKAEKAEKRKIKMKKHIKKRQEKVSCRSHKK